MAHPYLTFAAKRLVQAGVVLLLTYVFTFVVVSVLPGDPITSVLRNPQNGFTQDEIEAIIAAQGLDRPVLVQLTESLGRFVTGDFGLSMQSSRPVATLIAEDLAFGIALGSRFLPRALADELLLFLPPGWPWCRPSPSWPNSRGLPPPSVTLERPRT